MIRPCAMQRILCRYHDGSLSGLPRRLLEQHLPACPTCSQRLRELEETDALLSRARPVVDGLAPADRDHLFRMALAASNAGVHRASWLRRWRLAASLTLVAGIFGGLMAQHRSTAHGIASAAQGAESSPVQRVATASTAIPEQVSSVTVGVHSASEVRSHARPRFSRRPRRQRVPHPLGTTSGRDQLALAVEPRAFGDALDGWAPDEPQLLVIATRDAPALTIDVSNSSSDQPGFAQATSTTFTPFGAQVVTQATVSSCTPGEAGMETTPQQSSPPGEATDQNSMHQKEREKSDGMD